MTNSIDLTKLSDEQHDGLACVVCGRSDRAMVPIPIMSKYDSQLFRCVECDCTYRQLDDNVDENH